MKKWIVLILLLCMCFFTFSACIDTDEAMPHYKMLEKK